MIRKFILWAILAFLLLGNTAWADSYVGSLNYNDGLVGADVWNSAKLSWGVENDPVSGLWTYKYTFSVDKKAISHLIIGVSESFDIANIKDGTFPGIELGTFGAEGKSSPEIPEIIRGIKITPEEDVLTYSWLIVTDRAPIWTSFYGKSGKDQGEWVYAYNTEYGNPSENPITNGNNGGWVLGPGMLSSHELTVRSFAKDRFEKIRSIIAPEDNTTVKVKFIGRHVDVTSEHWTYILDATGEQIFRPVKASLHISTTFSNDITDSLEDWIEGGLSEERIAKAENIALDTIGANYNSSSAMVLPVQVFSTRELIASKGPDQPVKHYEGRSTVHFNPVIPDALNVRYYRSEMTDSPEGQFIKVERVDLPIKSFETAVTFSPNGRVMRIESTFLDQDLKVLLPVFEEGLAIGYIKGLFLDYAGLNFGAFFADKEWRFEASAYTWESVNFLPLPGVNCSPPNDLPYCEDEITYYYLKALDVYRNETFNRWCSEGKSNGLRGNCLDFDWATKSCQAWEVEGVRIAKHKNLRDYELNCGVPGPLPCPPTATNSWNYCTGISTPDYPLGGCYQLVDKFYDDLEQCHVALMYAHGGNAFGSGYFQMQKEEDIWFYLHREGQDGLGKSNLRYLFLTSCSSMNWLYGPMHDEYQNLFSDWMNSHVADGIRMACGTDGIYYGTEFDGFRFFRYYHLGDTIIQAWYNMALFATNNVPIVVAYGGSEDEAASILFDERSFAKERAGTGWSIAAELITEQH